LYLHALYTISQVTTVFVIFTIENA